METKNKVEYGVALSGGGLLSCSQVAILKVIEERVGCKPSIYTGTSGGSIVAGLLAANISSEEIMDSFHTLAKKALRPDVWYIIKGLLSHKRYIQGFLNGRVIEKGINSMTNYKRLAEINPKIGIIGTNINSGQEVIFTNVEKKKLNESLIRSHNYTIFPNSYERLSHVIHASCAFPGVFIPVNVSGIRIVDGGVTNNLPADLARALGAKKVISIDLGYSGKTETKGLYDVLNTSLHILTRRNVEDNKGSFGLYLDPKIYDINFLDASRIDETYNRGLKYANKIVDKVVDYLGVDQKERNKSA